MSCRNYSQSKGTVLQPNLKSRAQNACRCSMMLACLPGPPHSIPGVRSSTNCNHQSLVNSTLPAQGASFTGEKPAITSPGNTIAQISTFRTCHYVKHVFLSLMPTHSKHELRVGCDDPPRSKSSPRLACLSRQAIDGSTHILEETSVQRTFCFSSNLIPLLPALAAVQACRRMSSRAPHCTLQKCPPPPPPRAFSEDPRAEASTIPCSLCLRMQQRSASVRPVKHARMTQAAAPHSWQPRGTFALESKTCTDGQLKASAWQGSRH